MQAKHQRLALFAVVLVLLSTLVFGIRVIALPTPDRVAMLPDDAFYYLTLAKSFAHSGTWTFDGGVSLTTGFHPMFAYALTPLAALNGGRGLIDGASVLVFVLSLAMFGVAMQRALAARRWEIATALAMVLGSAVVMLLTTIVIEWVFAVLFMGLFWAEAARGDGLIGDARVRRRAALWMMLAVLARSDSVLLVGAFAAIEAVHAIRSKAIRWRAAWPVIGAIAGYALVTLHSARIAGELSQSSAATKLDWAMSQGISPGPVVTLVAQTLVPFELRFDLGLSGLARVGLIVVGLALVAACAYFTRKHQSTIPQPLLWIAVLTVLGYAATYSFNSAAMDTWYTAPFIAPLVVVLAAALSRLRALPLPALALAICAYLVAHAVAAHRLDDHRAAQRAVYALASETRAHVDTHRTGSINAGLFGFVQDGRVVNLDGLVNADIAPYRKADRLACYLVDHGIDYLEDVDLLPRDEAYWKRHGDPHMVIRAALRPFVTREVAGHSAALYRLDRAVLSAACQ